MRRDIVLAAAIDTSVAVSAVAFAAWLVVTQSSSWTVDDAFIVARYARHLANDGVLAFDLGVAPVEGFTSFFSVLWAAIAVRAGLDPIAALQALGATATIAGAPLVWLLGRSLRVERPAPGIAALVYATMGEHVSHARSGLETEVHAVFVLLVMLAFARALATPRSRVQPLALVALVACTVRPETAAAAMAAVAIVAWRRRADRTATRGLLLAFVLPLAVLVAARVAWFHSLLPNTYWAKRGPLSTKHAVELAELAADVVLPIGAAAVAAVATSWSAGLRIAHALSPRQRLVALLATLLVVVDGAVYARSLLVMDYARRFAFHSAAELVVLVLVIAGVAVRSVRTLATRNALAGAATAACAMFAIVTTALTGDARADTYREDDASYAAILRRAYAPAAALLRDELPRDATLAVYPDAGLVPWMTGLRTVDFGRLNDRYLAREARSPADVAAYFYRADPDAFLVAEPSPSRLFDEGAEAIAADARFDAYELRARFETERGAAVRVYLRRKR